MTTLSAAQIAGHAAAAGWSGEELVTAVAVALAESGGRTDARGDVALQTGTWGPSVGLWQIRSLNADRGTGRQRDELANLDPAVNARHAHEIWASSGWRPWSVYNSGAYRLRLPAARAGVAAPAVGGGVTPAAGATTTDIAWQIPVPVPGGIITVPLPFGGAITSSAEAAANSAEILKNTFVYLTKLTRWTSNPENWMRIAKVALGAGLLWVGVSIAARPITKPVTDVAEKVAKSAAKVALV